MPSINDLDLDAELRSLTPAAKMVKPGDAEEELLARYGSSFVTQSRIDGFSGERPYRNIGLPRISSGRADRRSLECEVHPVESKLTAADWRQER